MHFGSRFGSILDPFWCSGNECVLLPLYLYFEGHFGCPKRLQKSIKKPSEISSNFGWISDPILGRILAAFGLRFGLQKCIKCSMKEPSFSCTGSTNSSLQAPPGTSRKWLQNSIDFQSQKVSQNGSQKAPKGRPKTTLKTSRKLHQKKVRKTSQKMNPPRVDADQLPLPNL